MTISNHLSKQTTCKDLLKRHDEANASAHKVSFKEIEIDSSDEKGVKNEEAKEERENEQLLIIGFEDKPRGVNPLQSKINRSKERLGKRLSQRTENNVITKSEFWSPRIITQKLEKLPKFNHNKVEGGQDNN